MKTHQKTIGAEQEWLTPPEILAALGPFDLDPAAPMTQPWPTAASMLTVSDDGLTAPWHGRVWLNPPFDRRQRPHWMHRMARHGRGTMLVPAACETEAFARYVWPHASGICMLSARPHFHRVDGSRASANSGCTICLISYGSDDLARLRHAGLGVVITQWHQPTTA